MIYLLIETDNDYDEPKTKILCGSLSQSDIQKRADELNKPILESNAKLADYYERKNNWELPQEQIQAEWFKENINCEGFYTSLCEYDIIKGKRLNKSWWYNHYINEEKAKTPRPKWIDFSEDPPCKHNYISYSVEKVEEI